MWNFVVITILFYRILFYRRPNGWFPQWSKGYARDCGSGGPFSPNTLPEYEEFWSQMK